MFLQVGLAVRRNFTDEHSGDSLQPLELHVRTFAAEPFPSSESNLTDVVHAVSFDYWNRFLLDPALVIGSCPGPSRTNFYGFRIQIRSTLSLASSPIAKRSARLRV